MSRLLLCGSVITLLAACGTKAPDTTNTAMAATTTTASAGDVATADKIPVTSSSEEARTLFLRGQALADQLQLQDARQLFEQAAAKDPSFAMAHCNLALTAPTTKEFFAHLNEAVTLSDKASKGERLLILAVQAGASADPAKALDYSEQLAAAYPGDERAHLQLGTAYFARQQTEKSIDEFKKAVAINPDFSPVYNSLGYAYRQVGNYADAETAFKKYIALIPNNPNPYDSYGELLMKMGRLDESVTQYKKALSIEPQFGSSRLGIADDRMYQGQTDESIAEAQKLYDAARDDGDRRNARFNQAMTYVDAGDTEWALRAMAQERAMAIKIGDAGAESADVTAIGNILLNAGRTDEARAKFEEALKLLQGSNLSDDVKKDAALADHYNMGRVALAKGDLTTAKAEAAKYLSGADARQNFFRLRQAHELNGMIALRDKQYDQAIAELAQANQQDPFVLYVSALAYRGKGDAAKAKDLFWQAADMHILPTLNYVFIRTKAARYSQSQNPA